MKGRIRWKLVRLRPDSRVGPCIPEGECEGADRGPSIGIWLAAERVTGRPPGSLSARVWRGSENARRPTVVIAQALGEYVAASVLISAFTDAWLRFTDYVARFDQSTWLIVGGVAVVVGYLFSRST